MGLLKLMMTQVSALSLKNMSLHVKSPRSLKDFWRLTIIMTRQMVSGFPASLAQVNLTFSKCWRHYSKTETWMAILQVLSQTFSQGKLILFMDAVIQRTQQIVGMQTGWFYRTDVCGSCVRLRYLVALLKLYRPI